MKHVLGPRLCASVLLLSATLGCTALAATARADAPWKVSENFRTVGMSSVENGDVMIVVLRPQQSPGAKSLHRSTFSWSYDPPPSAATPSEKYDWGAHALDNGHGTFHWYHERLAFDRRTHTVYLIPRRGMNNVHLKEQGGSSFWCDTRVLDEETVAMDSYHVVDKGTTYLDVCPTAFVKALGETKGVRFLGKKEALYAIDTKLVEKVIADARLVQHVQEAQESMLAETQRRAEKAELSRQAQRAAAEKARTAHDRGQAAIAAQQIGERLCRDAVAQDFGTAVLVSGFLEAVRGPKVQIRINSVRTYGGQSSENATVRIDDVSYAPGAVVWSDANAWRACE
jgi:hypothetical protein